MASGARNTCSDFAVNRRSDDYTLVYFSTIDPDDLRATILSPGSQLYKKNGGKRKNRFSGARKIMALRFTEMDNLSKEKEDTLRRDK